MCMVRGSGFVNGIGQEAQDNDRIPAEDTCSSFSPGSLLKTAASFFSSSWTSAIHITQTTLVVERAQGPPTHAKQPTLVDLDNGLILCCRPAADTDSSGCLTQCETRHVVSKTYNKAAVWQKGPRVWP